MNYLTAHFALAVRGQLKAGESVLVHGAAGGVGTATIQMAKAYGARAIAVVSTAAKAEIARLAGADDVVRLETFKDEVKAIPDGRGDDRVHDADGRPHFTPHLPNP